MICVYSVMVGWGREVVPGFSDFNFGNRASGNSKGPASSVASLSANGAKRLSTSNGSVSSVAGGNGKSKGDSSGTGGSGRSSSSAKNGPGSGTGSTSTRRNLRRNAVVRSKSGGCAISGSNGLVSSGNGVFGTGGRITTCLGRFRMRSAGRRGVVSIGSVRRLMNISIASRSNGSITFSGAPRKITDCVRSIVSLGHSRFTRTNIGGLFRSCPVINSFLGCCITGNGSFRNFNRLQSEDNVRMSRGGMDRRRTVIHRTFGRFGHHNGISGCVRCLGSDGRLFGITGRRLRTLRGTSGRVHRTGTGRTVQIGTRRRGRLIRF